jgi:hypothetical protein
MASLTDIKAKTPYLLRLLANPVLDRLASVLVIPNLLRSMKVLEDMLEKLPQGNIDRPAFATERWMCGQTLTLADFMLSYPLLAAQQRLATLQVRVEGPEGEGEGGETQPLFERFPRTAEYIRRIQDHPHYVASLHRVRDGAPPEMQNLKDGFWDRPAPGN